jgi:hypothetical protein
MDGLRWRQGGVVIGAALVLTLATGCRERGSRPSQLLDGSWPGEFRPVDGSILTSARVVTRGLLGARFDSCLSASDARRFPSRTRVVERVGVFGESLTFTDAAGEGVWACDGGVDRAGERKPPWCGVSVGRLFDARLLDPRLDVGCATREGVELAYAWIQPVGGARWIGVDQGAFVEIYEVVGELPVRVATTQGVDAHGTATLTITHYANVGTELVEQRIDAAVAG